MKRPQESERAFRTRRAHRVARYARFASGCLMMGVLALGLGSARAAVYSSTYSSGFANGGNIPDGNPIGWADSRTLSGITDFSIVNVTVSLNISGGYNGDLYAYLSHDGILVPLLNRVGVAASSPSSSFGYSQTGFNVTLSDSGVNDVHFYGRNSPSFNGSGQLTGTWQADGRNISPSSSPSSFDSASRVSFSSYANDNPNGTWTLFIADMVAGDQSQLQSWTLGIEAVPEPTNVALGIFAGLGVAGLIWNHIRRRRAVA
jgi:subtilisin-like proprotein convertase family protein